MTTRVQAALKSQGYYSGALTGVLNEDLRAALRRYQQAKGLTVTGRMDVSTLTSLGIRVN